jgi:hypothetical protein
MTARIRAADRAGHFGCHLRPFAGVEILLALRPDPDPATGRRSSASSVARQSLVILTAGIDLSVGAIMVLSSVVMGQFTFRYGLPPEIAVLCGPRLRRALRLHQRHAGGSHAPAALHRHARHVADRSGHQLPLFRQRDHSQPGHRGPGADTPVLRQQSSTSAAPSSPMA